MRRETVRDGGAGSGRARRRRGGSLSWLTLAVVAALATAACGQYAGTHDLASAPVAGVADASNTSSGVTGAPALVPRISPNGENQGPSRPVSGYKIITVTKVITTRGADGPLLVCPVSGRGWYSDDFGAPRYAGGYHPHQGNDIFAAEGTPIVAPFPGIAVATPNTLGGQAVVVYGALGYVYNAHLSRYGTLGPVKTGVVIGYVGNTGDALGGPPHDHFEWHPGNGPAVNPYPYLREVC